jgi:Sec-independent protein translocase protein TatA
MKKKLKALLQEGQPTGSADLDRVIKALKKATKNFKKAREAKEEAKQAFKKEAAFWLTQQEMPHTPELKPVVKVKKAAKTAAKPARKASAKSPVNKSSRTASKAPSGKKKAV